MKEKLIVIGLFFILCTACDTENNIETYYSDYFIKYYGVDGDQEGVDFEVLPDGYLVLGKNVYTNTVFLVRTDFSGNELWSKQFGEGADEVVDMVVNPDAGYMVVANTRAGTPNSKVMVFNVDNQGSVVQLDTFGLAGYDVHASSITTTRSGRFIITGYTNKVSTTGNLDVSDLFSFEIDENMTAQSLWRSTYGWDGEDLGIKILERDNGYVFFGTTDHKTSNNIPRDRTNMFLFPINSIGDQTSTFPLQLYGTNAAEVAADIVGLRDGGYAMVGASINGARRTPFMVRVTSNGTTIFQNQFTDIGSMELKSVVQSADGNFLVLGVLYEDNGSNITILKIAADGRLLWYRLFGGEDSNLPGRIKELEDGSILFVSTIELENQTKMALIKVTPAGELTHQ
ncbi:hypothetical protein [Fulvivirga sediminis]|uniref:Uncharacterized protein n=1 Tax=Fulvivirga sediminis TaxID=2803949 RepID=A0A937K0L1_9BACT|nr:hypothetical protein [Fulvivirga sediminis]MBL3655692.1 hypothetical protein [Fulvivirga sediminis]